MPPIAIPSHVFGLVPTDGVKKVHVQAQGGMEVSAPWWEDPTYDRGARPHRDRISSAKPEAHHRGGRNDERAVRNASDALGDALGVLRECCPVSAVVGVVAVSRWSRGRRNVSKH